MPSLRYLRLIYVRVSLIAFVIFIGSLPVASQAAPKSVQERLGYPGSARLLILHADDFGMNHSVNRATSEALEHHWITSASILVPCPWFLEAANFARAHPDADLGIHQALTSEWTTFRWGPVTSRIRFPACWMRKDIFPATRRKWPARQRATKWRESCGRRSSALATSASISATLTVTWSHC